MGQRTYSCLIADDDLEAHLVLNSLLSQFEGLSIEGHAYNGKVAIDLLQSKHFDILWLDIQMPLVSGLELMQVLPNRPATIITSGHTEYAFEAFQNNVVDYLQKPILLERLKVAYEKALIYIDHVLPKNAIDTIELKSERKVVTLKVADIKFLKSMGNYVKVFMKNEVHPIIGYSSLKEMNDRLANSGFIQVHKSFIIKKSEIVKKSQTEILLKDGTQIPIGSKYDYLVERFLA
ncbi:MAG: response regulator transcription factor [Cyclobacteriaceae bacterium]|nr:response regulator transcription factor [Cyclobacteriaceae bacterium]